jgi:hypothetical protein
LSNVAQVYLQRDLDFIRPFGDFVGINVEPWYFPAKSEDGSAAWTVEGVGETSAVLLISTAKHPRSILLEQQTTPSPGMSKPTRRSNAVSANHLDRSF